MTIDERITILQAERDAVTLELQERNDQLNRLVAAHQIKSGELVKRLTQIEAQLELCKELQPEPVEAE